MLYNLGQMSQNSCTDNEHSFESSDTSDPDLNSKWSFWNLRKEFKQSHSENLFHLFQAKLQQSFFNALLILNIIFNLGAVISYAISKYHEMNLCKFQLL